MASNTTQRQIQGILLASKVQDYATWSLIVACRLCPSPRTIPLAELPPAVTIMQAMMRMRCRTCRGGAARQQRQGLARADREGVGAGKLRVAGQAWRFVHQGSRQVAERCTSVLLPHPEVDPASWSHTGFREMS